MTKRTDIHRPSLDGFDPQDYELFGVYKLVKKVKKLDGIIFVPGVPYGRWEEQYTVVDSRFKIDTDALESNGWSTDVVTNANGKERDSVHAHQCAHCGQHLMYGALLTNESEMSLIVVGEDCLENRFQNVTAAQFKQLREDARAKAAATRSLDRKNTVLKNNPRLSEAYESDNTFVQDVMRRFDRKGEISGRQIAAVIKVLDRDVQRAEQRKQWAAEAADAPDAPTGRIEVTGEVLSVKQHASQFGSTLKMTVKTDDGWKLWTTAPKSLTKHICFQGGRCEHEPTITGKRVTLTVTVTPSDRDPKFAFGKRPTNASVCN